MATNQLLMRRDNEAAVMVSRADAKRLVVRAIEEGYSLINKTDEAVLLVKSGVYSHTLVVWSV